NRRQPTALSAMRSHRSRAEMTRSTRRRTTILVPQLLSHYGRSNRSNDGGTQLLLRQRLPERFDHSRHATRSAVTRHRESSRHPRRIFLRHAMSTVKQFCHNPEQILDVLGDGAKTVLDIAIVARSTDMPATEDQFSVELKVHDRTFHESGVERNGGEV